MTIEYKEYADQKMIEIRVDGKVTRADYDKIVPRLEAFMAEHDKIRILEVVRDFGGFEPSVLTEGVKFDLHNMKHYSHCAVVSDYGVMGPIARLMSPLLSMDLRAFKLDQEPQARQWLKSA